MRLRLVWLLRQAPESSANSRSASLKPARPESL